MKRNSVFISLLFSQFLLFSQPEQSTAQAFKSAYAAYGDGNNELAIKLFNLAISLDPNRSYFYYNRGMVYAAMDEKCNAVSDFTKSLELKLTAEAYFQLGLIAYKQDDMVTAKDEFENGLQISEDIEDLNFYLGLIYFKEKNYNDSYKFFREYTNRIKTNGGAYYFLGYCEAELGKGEDAVSSLKSASLYSNKDWKFYLKMYDVYMVLHDDRNALDSINMVIELGQRKPEYYVLRSNLYKATGQEYLAEQDMKMADGLRGTASIRNGEK